MSDNFKWFTRGMRAGIPIGLGYLAVAFTLGISARNAGMTAFQASLSSFLVHASAGEFAGIAAISAGSSYIEAAIMEAVANARYLLMSFALSQKLRPGEKLRHRLFLGWYITDEVFALSVSAPGRLNPFYAYGAIALACPGWVSGTCLGVLLGNILPASLVSAFSVGLYGMFIAIFVPPARASRFMLLLISATMLVSGLMSLIPGVSSGIKTIIVTVAVAAAAAKLRPVQEERHE